ncbi:piwi domain-containing protein [Apiospora rasikravindrae]|uniref:Piwi domain-containing protein n=1 Tax=Apiospora rasikravindrae TaxID=990691 RepID=A0ABR1TWJ0_9PEZI
MAPDKKRAVSGGGDAKIEPTQAGKSKDEKPEAKTEQEDLTPQLLGKRVDLPPEAYGAGGPGLNFEKRPGYNGDGTIKILVNLYQVEKLPNDENVIYQYDISAEPNPKGSKTLAKRLWGTSTVQDWLKDHSEGGNVARWLYDGRALAWSLDQVPDESEITVTLPKKGDATTGSGGSSTAPSDVISFNLIIKKTAELSLHDLNGYLRGTNKSQWDDARIMHFNFLDHLLRQGPSTRLTAIRRSFYGKDVQQIRFLGTHTRAIPGTYAAFRPINPTKGIRLSVNVDVTHTAFWHPESTLYSAAVDMLKNSKLKVKEQDVIQRLKPVRRQDGTLVMSEAFQFLRRLEKIKFTIKHGQADKDKCFTVDKILFNEEQPDGADSTNVFFSKTVNGSTSNISVQAHFLSLGTELKHPNFPLIQTHSRSCFPFEVCYFAPKQRYPFKLDPKETSNMIKAAVARPPIRKEQIRSNVTGLHWKGDPHLKAFGIKVHESMLSTTARLLPRPSLLFKTPFDVPGHHSWNLKGLQFAQSKALESWVLLSFDTRRDDKIIKEFIDKFRNVYKLHSGSLPSLPTWSSIKLSFDWKDENMIRGCRELLQTAYNTTKHDPQIVFFLFPDRDTTRYERVKKLMDCHFQLPSQVLVFNKIAPLLQKGERPGPVLQQRLAESQC